LAVLGLGYVGRPLALGAAAAGYDVLGFDPAPGARDSAEKAHAGGKGSFQACADPAQLAGAQRGGARHPHLQLPQLVEAPSQRNHEQRATNSNEGSDAARKHANGKGGYERKTSGSRATTTGAASSAAEAAGAAVQRRRVTGAQWRRDAATTALRECAAGSR
jgi:hypothetical protein